MNVIVDMLDQFFYAGQTPVIELQYESIWVAFSVVLAITGSTVGLAIAQLSSRINEQKTRRIVQLTGAIAFGVTVWSMHFIGMLAVEMPMPVTYSPAITLASGLPAIIAAWFAIHWSAGHSGSLATRILTALLIAVGIGAMHFSGMLAMRMDALLRFDLIDFIKSLAIVIFLSYVAIWADEVISQKYTKRPFTSHAIGGLFLGLAIAGMHYEAMRAVRIVAEPEMTISVPPADRAYLGALVLIGVIAALGIGFSGALLTKIREKVKELQVSRQTLETTIAQSMHAVITTELTGRIVSVNPQALSLFHCSEREMVGKPLEQFLELNRSDFAANSAATIDAEVNGKTLTGSEVPLLMRRCIVESKTVGGVIIFLMDLSAFKNTERELYHQATHDSLTGLFNRRHLEAAAQREYAAMIRSGHPLTALMFDIDHFKQVNDTYGHATGDLTLKELARCIRPKLRKEDQLFRSGGEEFVLLLPDTSLTEAAIIGEKLRKAAEQQQLVSVEGENFSISISIGIETITEALPGGYEELISRADAAMYQAKRLGRNRVLFFKDINLSQRIDKSAS